MSGGSSEVQPQMNENNNVPLSVDKKNIKNINSPNDKDSKDDSSVDNVKPKTQTDIQVVRSKKAWTSALWMIRVLTVAYIVYALVVYFQFEKVSSFEIMEVQSENNPRSLPGVAVCYSNESK